MSTLLAYSAPHSPNPATYTKGAQAYLQTQVQSRTPVELVVMLYDGAIKFLGQARDALVVGDLVTKRHALSRGLAAKFLHGPQQALHHAQGDERARLATLLPQLFRSRR